MATPMTHRGIVIIRVTQKSTRYTPSGPSSSVEDEELYILLLIPPKLEFSISIGFNSSHPQCFKHE